MNPKDCITCTQPAFMLYDEQGDGACTTLFGSLAIFSTRGMAEVMVRSTGRPNQVKIVPVMITPIEEH